MTNPEKADYERIKTAADKEETQLLIQTEINAIVRAFAEKKLAEFPAEACSSQ